MKFIAVYCAPVATLEEWAKTDPDARKSAESQMMAAWDAWLAKNESVVTETSGLGKAKRIAKDGVSDAKNDLMLYSIVEAESPEAAAEVFEDHPHLGIPGSWIDVMPANAIPGGS